jgi:KDO2-lipid IV(A) lauroyltransferase
MMTRLGLAWLWLMRFLPLPVLAQVGNGVGLLLWVFAPRRRHITDVNLKLCFPQMSDGARARMVRAHFKMFGRSFVERSILWWSSERRIRKLIHVQGREHFDEAVRGKAIFLTAHFVGLDIGGNLITQLADGVSVYAAQRNKYFSEFLFRKRGRFRRQLLLSRQEGLRGVIKAVRNGHPFYYFADQDFATREAAFVPFFGIQTSTITTVPRLAQMTGAKIVPCISRILPGGQGYEVSFYPAWENYPTGDVIADTRRMNAFIEERVREMPEQYYWVHKRFKTRPEGEKGFY